MIKQIHLKGEWQTNRVWLNGKELKLEKSLKVVNHSPTGFMWSYNGSGPSQLALAICLELTDRKPGQGRYTTPFDYMDFREKYIAPLPASDFEVDLTVEIKSHE